MQPFLFCLERNNSQTFPCINSNWYNLLRLMLFIRYDKWKTLFFIKVYFFYCLILRSIHNNSTTLILKLETEFSYIIFFKLSNFLKNILDTLSVWHSSTVIFINLKTSLEVFFSLRDISKFLWWEFYSKVKKNSQWLCK